MKKKILFMLIFSLVSCEKQIELTDNFSKETIKDGIIYEVNIRQYSESGTFNDFTKDIPKLKDLGVKVLWLMPIHPISKTKRKGTLGSYYSITNYKEVNPEFGNKDDFNNLIKTAHENNMYVILDWVANHTGWDHQWIENNPNYYTKNSKGEITDPINPETGEPWGWEDVADLNFDNLEMQNEMIEAMEYWIRKHNIDGYRADAAHGCPVSFWKEVIIRLNKIKNVFMLAESDGYHPGGFELVELFDMSYSWAGHHILNEIGKNKNNVKDLINNIRTNNESYSKGHILMNFTSNHDENSWNSTVFERFGEGVKTFSALTYFLPGMPLIYNGQEYGLNKRLEFFEKDFIPKPNNEYFDFYKTLAKIKTENKVLHIENSVNFEIIETNNSNVILLKRENNGELMYFLANLSDKSQEIILNLNGDYTSLINNTSIHLNKNYNLNPWEFHFLM
ncbi:MAG: alpha-amylase family glycosyl hydrolase [Flavobacteriales bacterium]|jgi:alpha-amylase|tara:strand:- start:2355 stop:3701 length:1347 start_codon:yes stop_codon:yes gene_type:complete